MVLSSTDLNIDAMPGSWLLFVVGVPRIIEGPPHAAFRSGRVKLEARGCRSSMIGPQPQLRPHPVSSRQGHLQVERGSIKIREFHQIRLMQVAQAFTSPPQLKSFPSAHMRCRITASLRATATFAFAMPERLAIAKPQALRLLDRFDLVSTALAAS